MFMRSPSPRPRPGTALLKAPRVTTSRLRSCRSTAVSWRPFQDLRHRHAARGLTGDRWLRQRVVTGFDDEPVLERIPRARHAWIGRRFARGVMLYVAADERGRHSELGIRLQVGIVVRVHLRELRLVARLADQEMDVRR